MFGVSAASLFYLNHLRSCAATAVGAKGTTPNVGRRVWFPDLLGLFLESSAVSAIVCRSIHQMIATLLKEGA